MKRWNYRVIIKNGTYAVHECFYNDKGYPVSISKDETWPIGESFAELKEDLKLMIKALERPILKYEYFRTDN